MNYHNITKDDMLNGDGLRAVLWVSGCEHHCPECHNPITWDVSGGLPFDEKAKKELFDAANKSYISGITLSGGDPLHMQNRDTIAKLITEFKKTFDNKTIWLYTGYEWDAIKHLDFIPLIDVIVDGRFEVNLKDTALQWKGSANQRVIDVPETLKRKKLILVG